MRHLIQTMCVIIFVFVPNPEAHVRIDDGDHIPVSMPALDYLDGGLHQVNVGMRVHKIFDIKTESKSFTTTIELLLSWRDVSQRHGGEAQIIQDRASLSRLWIPNLYFKTARRTDSGDQSLAMAAITRDGTVTYSTTYGFPSQKREGTKNILIIFLDEEQSNLNRRSLTDLWLKRAFQSEEATDRWRGVPHLDKNPRTYILSCVKRGQNPIRTPRDFSQGYNPGWGYAPPYPKPQTDSRRSCFSLNMELQCHMNVEKYPFDEHKCDIELASYSLGIQQLNMSWFQRHIPPLEFDKHLDTRNIIGHNTSRCDFKRSYAIERSGAHSAEFACLRAQIHFKRPITFHLFQCFLPTVLIVISSWLGFWIDRHSAIARVTLQFVSLLTLIVHGTAMRAKAPAVTEATAIDHMFAVCMVFVFCALMEFGIVHLMMHASQKYLDLAKGNDSIRQESRLRHERLARVRLQTVNGKDGAVAATDTYNDLLNDKFRRKGEQLSLNAIRVDMTCRAVFPIAFSLCTFLFIFFYVFL